MPRPPMPISRALVAMGILALTILPGPCSAADGSLEYGVKAAFLLNFTKFIDWPPTAFANPRAPIEICILGKDPFGRILDDIVQGETANGRPIAARRLSQSPAPETCHVLFVEPELKDLAGILSTLPPGILTVGEGDHFLHDGGMIALVIDDRRVRFDINQTAAEKAGLKLRSKLLTVARTVSK